MPSRSFHIRLPRILVPAALALLTGVAIAHAQVLVDAQIPFNFTGLSEALTTPSGVAVAPDGTVYVVDVENSTAGRVIRVTPSGTVGGASGAAGSLGATVAVLNPSVSLTAPTAVAVDSAGDLYIADSAGNQVVKMAHPETSSAATTILYPGTETPTALAVDSSNNLYIADETQNAIYEVTGTTATRLNIKTNLMPVGLAVDSTGNVYFADALHNEIYKYTASSEKTDVYLSGPSVGNFRFSAAAAGLPIGMGFDPAGYLYVLDSARGRLWQINSTTPATNYEVHFSGIANPGSLAVSSVGNLYMSDDSNATLDELFYNNNPFNFGSIAAGTRSAKVTLNYDFVSAKSGVTFYQSIQGDDTGEFIAPNENPCLNSSGSGASAGTMCSFKFEVEYQASTPGLRSGVFGLTDSNGDALVVPVNGTSSAVALALYPGMQSILSQASRPLYEPQGMAVTGDGGTLFIADEGGNLSVSPPTYSGAVWAYTVTAGNILARPTRVGNFTTPITVALGAAGDLFVADYSGTVTKIPPSFSHGKFTWPGTGGALTFPAGVTLDHPIALAFDPSGNLYIGDAGPLGSMADASNPGFIVEVPADGAPPFKLPNLAINGIPIVYPQALATDSYGNLYIGDGGDYNTDPGGVDVLTASTGALTQIPFATSSFGALNSPSALAFDAANDLYVLDCFNSRILVAPVTYSGTTPSVNLDNAETLGGGSSGITTNLATPSDLVVWPGGQTITVTDIGFEAPGATTIPTQVVTLQSMNTTVNASSGSASVAEVNVGNQEITFGNAVIGGTDRRRFTFSGCGSTYSQTLTTGVDASDPCAGTIGYDLKGRGLQVATITLNDGSALGNVITVEATPAGVPYGALTGGGRLDVTHGTVTLTSTGGANLVVTGYSVTNLEGTTVITGGSCTTYPSLAPGQSCTLNYSFTSFTGWRRHRRASARINVVDNNGGIAGTTQSIGTSYDRWR